MDLIETHIDNDTTEFGFVNVRPVSVSSMLRMLSHADEDGECSAMADAMTQLIAGYGGNGGVYMEWEPFSMSTTNDPFRMVLIAERSGQFAKPNEAAFSEYFPPAGQRIASTSVAFPNRGHDAMLVAPVPIDGNTNGTEYGHIAAFMRTASRAETRAFWKCLGETTWFVLAGTHLNGWMNMSFSRTVWISTAGHGVPWLHGRVSLKPAYYRYAPFTVKPK